VHRQSPSNAKKLTDLLLLPWLGENKVTQLPFKSTIVPPHLPQSLSCKRGPDQVPQTQLSHKGRPDQVLRNRCGRVGFEIFETIGHPVDTMCDWFLAELGLSHVLSDAEANGQESLGGRRRAGRAECESSLILHREGERGIWGLRVPLSRGLVSWMLLRVEGSGLVK
jgi:hypothetical protein